MDILFEMEKGVIVIVSLLMAYAEFAQAVMSRRSWVNWCLGLMGLYWAVYYSYSIYRSLKGLQFGAHQIFVRAGILVTVALITSGALMALRKLKRLQK